MPDMITPERKAQLDALIQQHQQGATSTVQPPSTGIAPERKAQLDALISQYKNQQPAPPDPNHPGGFQGFVQGVASPFLKLGSSIAGIAQGGSELAGAGFESLLGNKAASQQLIGQANQDIGKQRDFGYFGKVSPIGYDQTTGQPLNPLNTLKDVAGTALDIGSYIAPIGIESKGTQLAAQAAIDAGETVAKPTITGLIKGGTVQGLLGNTGKELQNPDSTLGSIAGAAGTGILGGAGTAGILGVGGKLLGGLSHVAGNLGAEVLGKATGAGEGAIREAFTNPNVTKFMRGGAGTADDLMLSALEDARNGLDKMTSSNSSAYREAMTKIQASPQDLSGAVSDIRSKIVQDATEGFGVRFGEGKGLNNLDFNKSDVVEGTNSVQRAFDRLFGEPINTIEDLDRVKKSLGRIAAGTTPRSPAQALIYRMKDAVSSTLKERVPGYAKEMSRFSDAADISDEITKALSLGDKTATDTAVRKLMSTMRQNNELRKSMLQAVGTANGGDAMGKIAGATLMSKTPRGLAGTLQPTALGITGLSFGPASIPGLLLYLSSTSPRLVGELTALLGKFNGPKIPVVIQQQIRNLLLKAEQEASVGTSDQSTPQDHTQGMIGA